MNTPAKRAAASDSGPQSPEESMKKYKRDVPGMFKTITPKEAADLITSGELDATELNGSKCIEDAGVSSTGKHASDWKKDPGERARRILEWWKQWFLSNKQLFPRVAKMIRLVVLMHPSSCAVERVFSQLNYIRRMVGDATLEDMMELRCMFRCNSDYKDEYD